MTPIRKKFADNLKKIRESKGYTQEQLAEKLDISTRYIQLLESSKRCPNVKIETLASLAKALTVKPGAFLSE